MSSIPSNVPLPVRTCMNRANGCDNSGATTYKFILFRRSKHGVGRGLLILEGWFDSSGRSHILFGICVVVAQQTLTLLV